MSGDGVSTHADESNPDDVVITQEEETTPQLNGRKISWTKLRRGDSLDIESASLGGRHHQGAAADMGGGVGWAVVLQLAFQSIGVVYGDIGTSPLYVFASTFTDGIKHNDDIIGVLSLIFYTITLIPLIKYVFIVLRANDHGDGGTFALYSLICRYIKVSLLPSQELEDRDVSTFQLELPNKSLQKASKLQAKLENSNFAKYVLLFATMLGTSMVIGDGVLTPCISVLSAVGGIKEATSHMTEGGTFALYSLICRYIKVSLLPSQELEDRDVSTFQLELPNKSLQKASKLQAKLENSNFAKYVLLFATMLGTSMVIGDGVLTPCISVLSAVGGIKEATSHMTEDGIVWTSVVILVALFMVQRFGTDKVGYSFGPIICIWFLLIGGVGVFNLIKYDTCVIKALNPIYIVDYLRRNKDEAWISLGGVVLAITGTEALFADVGHFTVRSIQISMCCVTYPALVLAYSGQASFLRKNNHLVANTFYESIPGKMYWPMFVVAVAASIIASQAMISATFSIIQQCLSLGCFPRVKIVHTSTKYPGQVYIPEVNYLLMFACICVTLGFRTTTKIGNAYGIAVVLVMMLTSTFLVLVMVMIWKTNILFIILYILIIGSVELLYLSSVLYKFDQGGYLPLAFAMILMIIMCTWNYVYRKKYYFELDHKISPETVREIVMETSSPRLPGLAVFYSELVHGIPPIFKHYVANVPALHSVLMFVSFKSLPISRVPEEERFLFRRVQPNELQVFRCVVRYGYKDVRNEEVPFERLLIERLKEFVQRNENEHENGGGDCGALEAEIGDLDRAWRSGVVHMVGEHEVVAAKGAAIWKRVVIDYGYNFLKNNLRQSNRVFDIPHKRMLKVGMTYQL